MSQAVQEIKSRLGILDVVGSYLKLERAGTNYKAKCPFHTEKTPSFFVSPSRDGYYCFGCNRGGDIFTFVQEIEHIPFIEALHILASRAGVELVKEDPRTKTDQETMREILRNARSFFRGHLSKRKDAEDYLLKRGLEKNTIEKFEIGYAPDSWEALSSHLQKEGFPLRLIEEAGLIIPGKEAGRFYDRFRNRIMFPLWDQTGRVIGFSGRIFGEGKEAKYINTPETVLYKKGSILYPYHLAKDEMKKKNAALLVEGQMDVIMAHQAGISHALAVSGTAFTERHIELISRLSEKIILAFDADSAGLRALLRAAKLALSLGLEAHMISLQGAKDPADLLRDDKEGFVKNLESSTHVIPHILSRIQARYKDDGHAQMKAVRTFVLPLVAAIDKKLDQSHFISLLAEELAVSENAVSSEVEKIQKTQEPAEASNTSKESGVEHEKGRKERILERMLGIISLAVLKPATLSPEKLSSEISVLLGEEKWREFQKEKEKDASILSFEAELLFGDGEGLDHAWNDLFRNLKEELLKESFNNAVTELRRAEKEKDEAGREKFSQIVYTLAKELSQLRGERMSY